MSDNLNHNPSICIPRVYSHINKKYILDIFQNKIKIGPIKKIDMINTNDKDFRKIFIHFHHWNNDLRTSGSPPVVP